MSSSTDLSLPKVAAAALLAAGIAAAGPAAAEDAAIYTDMWGVAIEGHDPVSYFAPDGPQKGRRAHEMQWRGATWRFATEENLVLFASMPDVYAPAYGGYGALALAEGALEPSDPERWRLLDGRLYLLSSEAAAARWEREHLDLAPRAHAHWRRFVSNP